MTGPPRRRGAPQRTRALTPRNTCPLRALRLTNTGRRGRSTSRVAALLVGVALAASNFVFSATDAAAYSGAEFTTVQEGSRGHDVRAVQYLLNHHGYSTAVDGVFGSSTKSKVMAFQGDHGLTVDGIVGPATWSELVVTVYLTSSGNAVRAVQWLLNGKRDPGNPAWGYVSVDGYFGYGTRTAVRNFQSHMGISVDGVVGPVTWKNLVWHYVLMQPDSYTCGAGGQPASESWGTASSVAYVRKAGRYFDSQATGDLPFWDFSVEHGGNIANHDTHERGMDVDIGLISTNDNQCGTGAGGRGMTYTDPYYDRSKTIAMTDDVVAATSNARWIEKAYFNDPQVYSRYSFMGPLSSHDHHIHFRFCVQYYPSSTTPSYSYPADGNYDC